MRTTGIIHHLDHSNMYTNTSYNIQLHMARSPCCEFPLVVPFSTYLAPSRCDRNGPPQSQVARKLIPFVPHCSLVPSPPNSQPFPGFPELNVHLIRATSQTLFPVYNTRLLSWSPRFESGVSPAHSWLPISWWFATCDGTWLRADLCKG